MRAISIAPTWARAAFARSDKFVLFVLAVALAYVLARLSPSSYGLALDLMGIPNQPLFGRAQPLRTDEWAIWTPYIQAAVNNDFGRFNLTSVYQEDFRNFNALPLRDWALVFKPEFWAFFVLEPARAFSIYHAFFMAAFVIGWYGFFCRLGFDRVLSALASLCFFYTASIQGWWTTVGPVVALFPFLPWIFLSNLPAWVKAPVTAWVTAVWLIAHLYPPIIVTLAFAGATIVIALRMDALRDWRSLVACAIGGAFGVAISYLYLHDVFTVMADTVYPGGRRSDGGTTPLQQWIGQLLPRFSTVGEAGTDLPNTNYLEASTAATFLLVFALCFANVAALRALFTGPAQKNDRRVLAILGGAFLAMSVWELAPIPHQIGALLLWDRVMPHRMIFAIGALLVVVALVILRAAPPVVNVKRISIATGVLALSFLVSKGLTGGHYQRSLVELLPIAPLALLLLLRGRVAGREALAVAATACISGVIAFGGYNPLQSAWPIFHRPPSPVADQLAIEQAQDPRGWVVNADVDGAILNGWGFRSVGHTVIRPQLTFFREMFPEMDPGAFNFVFNRYANVHLKPVAEPGSPQPDVIEIPIDRVRAFRPDE